MAVSLHDGKRPATGMGMGNRMGNNQRQERDGTGQPLGRDETGHGLGDGMGMARMEQQQDEGLDSHRVSRSTLSLPLTPLLPHRLDTVPGQNGDVLQLRKQRTQT